MPVQDDVREHELVRIFNLDWDRDHQRSGVDAHLELEVDGQAYRFEVEVKSTTRDSVGSARDVGIEHIAKWRTKFFVIGYYSREAQPVLKKCLCLSPSDMEPWIRKIEDRIATDFRLAALASSRLSSDDLHAVLGEKDYYTIADAKALHKRQWSADEYKAARDVKVRNRKLISPAKMLEILQLRSKYIAERGATLNNPKLEKSFLQPFLGTDREAKKNNWAASMRQIATDFVRANPGHPAAIPLPVVTGA